MWPHQQSQPPESILTAIVVGTGLSAAGPISYRGFIDLIDISQGVRGWVLDLASPQIPQRLELMVGDIVVAEIVPDGPRHDISEALGVIVTPGFSFDAASLAMVADLAESADDAVSVRIAGTQCRLGIGDAAPTAAQIIKQQRLFSVTSPNRSSTADFELLLDDLRADAVALAEQALRPVPENLQGYIETLALDTSGQVWMVGWMRRGHLTEFSAVISERRKIPAAVAIMTYSRDDLPADACGVIGLLSSSWRPTSATAEFYLFFGAGGRFHLRSHLPIRFVTPSELVAEYEHVRERCLGEGRAIALQRMLTSMESWLPTRSTGQAYATETSVDRVLLVPGLGCLVEGWVISPMKRVEGLRLRIGGAVMAAQADATYWKPRPDLLSAFPGSDALVARAGFVALFAGDADPEDFADPVVKVVFEGGASANWTIPPKVFRRLGHSADIDDAQIFFPALQEESFFPRFAEAAIRAQRRAMNPPVPMTIKRTRRALVLVLPEDRCDMFLLFEELAQQCRTGTGVEGVAFVAAAKSNRSDALWLFHEFQVSTGMPCSLLVIDDAAHAFALLPDILREIGANRFVFVGAGVFLTDSGWQHVRQILQATGPDLVFLGLQADAFEQRDLNESVTARCFAWTTPLFVRWAITAAPYLGGYYRENGLFRSNVAHVVHHGAAHSSRTLLPARIQEAVNATVYGMSGQF
jgi:hypothetical protein